MMAGCVLVCSTSESGRMHCKQEMAANASLCHQVLCCNADVDVVLLRHVLLLGASLTVIVAGCVLVGSTHGCGRMHCNHQELPLQVQSCAFIANARSKCKRTVLAFLLSVAACSCSHVG